MRTFVEEITSTAMRERLSALRSERVDLAVLFQLLGPRGFLEWGHSIGVTQDDQLRRIAPPVAPFKLRRITADIVEPAYLYAGLRDTSVFVEHYRHHGKAGAQARVLDFGCGAGRMTRFLSQSKQFQVSASEVNPDHVAWCRLTLDAVTTKQNDVLPPLDFEAPRSISSTRCPSSATWTSPRCAYGWTNWRGWPRPGRSSC